MTDLNIIDTFLETFVAYLDSGFGLLKGDVGHLAATLIAIDVTLAALFWVMDEEAHLFARLIRKVLYVGAFAFIITHFSFLAEVIYDSFAGLGLRAGGGGVSAHDLLRPGKLAATGFEAAHPLLEQIADLLGLDTVFGNLLTIVVLLVAWLLVILSFFLLAVQLFICVLEFKLTTLAGFVLVPFALWNKTAFLAERVLGNVVTSGIKVMVMAVIVGIGSGFFDTFITALDGAEPDLMQAMTLVLASLTLLGLGLFGPTVASGLVTGAPQLGAGSVAGTLGAAAGAGMLAGGAIGGAARALAGAGGSLQAVSSAASRLGGGSGGAGASSPPPPPPSSSTAQGSATGASASDGATPPAWAKKMQAEQRTRARIQMVQAAILAGDQASGSASPNLSQKD
ncbi:P-type conjugative transfer protein TrbL [Asticcacaulis excentricus]|uniref:P-type conjugative transfer protein TrbL n=1 Tax=Asticcacaulis excentricus (strain ATCC 15261 / DSM 4724 / KCTC 12464 / NCIMB 9791 / VKM B-1370 / CB 48) TaxID=573065 RepID=E8RS41_ASTEC|nr:P-type conjugative transfer protein TrbL [Asticcacaulis excentricus]ADU14312.1 P-type conjugative transfer protein TrbL [Asticcacaulis excentricus CB 48]